MNMNFIRNRRALGIAAVTAALLVPLGVFGAPALARSADSAPSQYQYKITICHHTHSAKHPWVQIKVSSRAWKGHQKHGGDFLVTGTAPCPPVTAPASTKTHGKSGDQHGNSGAQHGDSGTEHGKGHGK